MNNYDTYLQHYKDKVNITKKKKKIKNIHKQFNKN